MNKRVTQFMHWATCALILGGSTLANVTRPLQSALGSWLRTGNLGVARRSHTATLLPNGKVLVVGGFDDTGFSGIASAELYDPVTESWSNTGSLRTGRGSHTATLLPNGKVLVAGGLGRDITPLNSAELYDPATGSWSSTGSPSVVRVSHTATLLANGKVLVAGGINSAFNAVFGSAELYDPAAGTWSSTGSLNVGRLQHTATLLADGKVLVAGGGNIGLSYFNSAELYNPATGAWSNTGNLNVAHRQHTATLLPDGRVLVAGGKGQTQNVFNVTLNSAELYNPATGIWLSAAALNTARYLHTATLLPSGKVLVASDADLARTTELYDPVAGRWDNTGSLNAAHIGPTATLLLSGKVLLAGGAGEGTNVAELFDLTISDGCTYSLSPTSQTFSDIGGTGMVAVNTQGGCNWAVINTAPWITLLSSSGTGNGNARYSVAANPGNSSRTATLTIAGQPFTVTQAPACPTVSGISPMSGVTGTAVTITGSNFAGVTAVKFADNVTASFVVVSNTQITTAVPSGAVSGPLTISKPGCADSQTSAFTVLKVSTIAGSVNYCITPQPVSGVVLTATTSAGATAATAMSGGDGRYALTVTGPGPFRVTPAKNGGVNGISAYDAALVARHVTGLGALSFCQQLAADANRDGILTAADAELVLRQALGLAGGGQAGMWRFNPDKIDYPPLNGDQTNQNYDAVLIGDVSGNWSRATALMITSVAQVDARDLAAGLIIKGEGFQPGLSLSVASPNGDETRLREPALRQVTADSFVATFNFPARGRWTLRVVNADGRTSAATIINVP